MHACNACMHTSTRTHARARARAHTHTHTHEHTHTHTCGQFGDVVRVHLARDMATKKLRCVWGGVGGWVGGWFVGGSGCGGGWEVLLS